MLIQLFPGKDFAHALHFGEHVHHSFGADVQSVAVGMQQRGGELIRQQTVCVPGGIDGYLLGGNPVLRESEGEEKSNRVRESVSKERSERKTETQKKKEKEKDREGKRCWWNVI